ncbi:hypothetical protein MBLNU230_g7900t1 [Neophaeotheca triangularis]
MSGYRPTEVRVRRLKDSHAPERLLVTKAATKRGLSGEDEAVEHAAKKGKTSQGDGHNFFAGEYYQRKEVSQPNFFYQRKIIEPQGARKASGKAPKQPTPDATAATKNGQAPEEKRKGPVFRLEIEDETRQQGAAGESKRRMPTLVEEGVKRVRKTDPSCVPTTKNQTDQPVNSAVNQLSNQEILHSTTLKDYSGPDIGQSQPPQAVQSPKQASPEEHESGKGSAAPVFKRPGKGSAIPRPPGKLAASEDHAQVKSLANQLHEFALEVSGEEEKPKRMTMPKLSAARSREIHERRRLQAEQQRQAQAKDAAAMDVDSDGDYVYDTYLLVEDPAARERVQSELGDVGYILITAEDQPYWEEFMEDDKSDKDWNSEEEDENAEDFYGADYPDDELASDDEYDRGAYQYRAGGSDDEEYDRATWSDDDDDEADQWASRPWKRAPNGNTKDSDSDDE